MNDDKLVLLCEVSYTEGLSELSTIGGQTEQQFPLCLANDFENLLLTEKQTDCTISTLGASLKVHRTILAARSSVLAEILAKDGPNVSINIDKFTFELFLQFIYSGKVERLDWFAEKLLPLANLV